jgi:hypothetical protein
MQMQRRTFFKSFGLGAAALFTPKITRWEAEAASEIPTPKALQGCTAFVTTLKGPTAIIQHNLGAPCVFVAACNLDGHPRSPRVDPLDNNRVKLTFEEPWHTLIRRKVYKVVISSTLRSETPMQRIQREREQGITPHRPYPSS